MTSITKFSDDVIKGRWARVTMSDGQPCFIAIGPRSVVIKRSRTGIIGPRLFEIRRLHQLEKLAAKLDRQFPSTKTPKQMINPLLRPIVNAILHCNSLQQVLALLAQSE